MWVEITENDLLTQMSGVELAKLRAVVLKSGQPDPVQPVFDQITRQVRSHVAACRRNLLGDGNTIPNEFLADAVALAVIEIMTRAGGTMIDPKGARMEAARRAQHRLELAADCKLAIEAPAIASNEVIGTPAPAIPEQCLKFGYDREGDL